MSHSTLGQDNLKRSSAWIEQTDSLVDVRCTKQDLMWVWEVDGSIEIMGQI